MNAFNTEKQDKTYEINAFKMTQTLYIKTKRCKYYNNKSFLNEINAFKMNNKTKRMK